MDFITVKGRTFRNGDESFFFNGANCYYLMESAATDAGKKEVIKVLDGAYDMEMTAITTWAFRDGKLQNALQPRPGKFNEDVFRGLDWLIKEADDRYLKLVLVLNAYWPGNGGMSQYVEWATNGKSKDQNDFYKSAKAQQLFENFVKAIVNRKNSVTGKKYRDDPAIMAWSVGTGMRNDGDKSGNELQNWLERSVAFVRKVDPNHLVTFNYDGFFGETTSGLTQFNPYDTSVHGIDFYRNHSIEGLSFASCGLWTDNWLDWQGKSDDEKMRFSKWWIEGHMDLAGWHLNMPLVFCELAKKSNKETFFKEVYKMFKDCAANGGPIAGSMMWMLCSKSFKKKDDLCVTTDGEEDRSLRDVILQHSSDMADCNMRFLFASPFE